MKPGSPRAKRRHQQWRKVRRVRKMLADKDKAIGSSLVRKPWDAQVCANGGMSCTHYGCHMDKRNKVPKVRERRAILRSEDET